MAQAGKPHSEPALHPGSGKLWYVLQVIQFLLVHPIQVFVEQISFHLTMKPPKEGNPEGYLFVCPPAFFEVDSCSFRWPECPTYWALDPEGLRKLETDEAKERGFPQLELTTTIAGRFWDPAVYSGLRRFHAAEGMNPDSRAIEHSLEYPRYEITNESEG